MNTAPSEPATNQNRDEVAKKAYTNDVNEGRPQRRADQN